MVAKVTCVAPIGFTGSLVEVECDAKRGLPTLQIVGMGNKAIDEAKERVKSAIANSLLEFPSSKITINLAPAELPKDGSHYDLAIAIATETGPYCSRNVRYLCADRTATWYAQHEYQIRRSLFLLFISVPLLGFKRSG